MGRAEAHVEHYLVKQVAALKGVSRKLTWIGRSGAPDRLVILPGGRVLFVECKSATGRLSRQQEHEIKTLAEVGVTVHVVHTREEVDALLSS